MAKIINYFVLVSSAQRKQRKSRESLKVGATTIDRMRKLRRVLTILSQMEWEPSSTRWQYWSLMKDVSFCFEKKIARQKSKQAAFHLGPVLQPSGEGSPLLL